jgi:hypothetical protein
MDLGKAHRPKVQRRRQVDPRHFRRHCRLIESARPAAFRWTTSPGTFTLTNLGAWDIDDHADRQPPERHPGAGRIVEKPVARTGRWSSSRVCCRCPSTTASSTARPGWRSKMIRVR